MKLFSTAEGDGWNAELPSNSLRFTYGHYARGYFNASKLLLRSEAHDDVLTYPAIFNFRHGVELALKSLARDLHVVGEAEELGKPGHPLREIWEKVREPIVFYSEESYFDDDFYPDRKLSPVEVDDVIGDLDKFDKNSMAFRYPVSLKGQPSLVKLPLLDMKFLLETVDHVSNGLMIWVDWAFDRAEDKLTGEWKISRGNANP